MRDRALKGLLAAVFYGVVSIAITFFNKAVLSLYDFRYSNFMTFAQMGLSILFLVSMKQAKLIDYPPFEPRIARKVAPLSICFFGMVVTGLAALRYLNVPMFSALRRFTTLITMLSEYWMQGKRSSMPVVASLVVMLAGALVAAAGDLSFNLWGYLLALFNCFVTAGYLVYISIIGKSTEVNDFGMMLYNNVLSLPVVLLMSLSLGELEGLAKFPYLYDPGFLFCFFFSSSLAFILNYSIFLCTTLNSALTTSVTGQIKNVATTVVGLFLFGDVQFHPLNIVGLALGVLGSVMYSYIKFKEVDRSPKAMGAATPAPSAVLPVTSGPPTEHSPGGNAPRRRAHSATKPGFELPGRR